MASSEKISSEQMDNFMDVLGFTELSIKERTGTLRRTVKEKVYEKGFGAGKIRIYSSVAGVESRDVGKDAIRVQYWVDGIKVFGATRVHRVKNWRRNVLNRVESLEDMIVKGSLRQVPQDSSGKAMVVRRAHKDGKKFWGSSDYPRNNETRRFNAVVIMPKKPITPVEKAMAWHKLIEQAELQQMLMELEHNVRIGLIDEDKIMSSLKKKFGAEDDEPAPVCSFYGCVTDELFIDNCGDYYCIECYDNGEFDAEDDEPMWCACGCDGSIADHDDRGYGCWPCIECGDDSDTDIGELCSDCDLDVSEAEYNTVANSPLGEIVTDDAGRRYVLVDEQTAQIIFEQSKVMEAHENPTVRDSISDMLNRNPRHKPTVESNDNYSQKWRRKIAAGTAIYTRNGWIDKPVISNAEGRPAEDRMTRVQAEALADKMTKLLGPYVDFVEVCGSYRRGRSDPGDLDIVIILKENESLPLIVEKLKGQYTAVNWLGEKKTQIVVDGVKVDIKVSSPEGLGAALLYFTGPGGYNIGMRRSAKSKGLKLNEYGIWTRDTNVYLGGATEEEIYTVLEKTYKPPEMRAEDRLYENKSVRSWSAVPEWPSLATVQETFNPYWLRSD